jgi:hypothetical protein
MIERLLKRSQSLFDRSKSFARRLSAAANARGRILASSKLISSETR